MKNRFGIVAVLLVMCVMASIFVGCDGKEMTREEVANRFEKIGKEIPDGHIVSWKKDGDSWWGRKILKPRESEDTEEEKLFPWQKGGEVLWGRADGTEPPKVELKDGKFFPWQEEGESLWQKHYEFKLFPWQDDDNKEFIREEIIINTRFAPVGYSTDDFGKYPDKERDFETGGIYTGFGANPTLKLIFKDKDYNHIIRDANGDIFWSEPTPAQIDSNKPFFWVTFELDKNRAKKITEIHSFEKRSEKLSFSVGGIEFFLYPVGDYMAKSAPPFIPGFDRNEALKCAFKMREKEFIAFEAERGEIRKNCYSTKHSVLPYFCATN